MTTLYDDLGLRENADAAAIKAAHRRLARQHHPDRGGDPDRFSQVQRAYEVLSNPQRRLTYDDTGHVDDVDPMTKEIAEAQTLVASTFLALIQDDSVQLELMNVRAGAVAQIKQGRMTIREKLSELARAKARMTKAQKRLKWNGKEADVVSQGILEALRNIERNKELVERQARVYERAEGIAGQYDWTVDQVSPATSGSAFFLAMRG